MYEDFYGLREKPFSIQPDPSFLYWGRGHRLAYAMLEYGVLNHAGISVITGEVGCGKTTLIHRLLEQLSDTHSIALLSNIQQGRGDLLSWVLMGFGQSFSEKSHVELFSILQKFFISEYSKGRRVIVVIDEAQNLSVDMLEELRMLSNINAGKDQLLQLILVGQPQLKDILNRPDMLQLAQRVGSDFHLTPLTRDEVRAYIDTRLTIAGALRRIFSDRAVDLIAEQSRGVPRVINIMCDTALVYGFSGQDQVIDEETIKSVIRDKGRYGVFGIAADKSLKTPVEETDGPAALMTRVGGDGPVDAAETRQSPPRGDAGDAAPERSTQTAEVRQFASSAPEARETLDAAVALAQRLPAVTQNAPARVRYEPSELGEIVKSNEAVEEPVRSNLRTVSVAPLEGVIGVVVSDLGARGKIQSPPAAPHAVFIAVSGDRERSAEAVAAGYDVVTVKDGSVSLGRAWNAGYRRLKKISPNVTAVQFVTAGVKVADGWVEAARDFLNRRPEVAIVEGAEIEPAANASVFAFQENLENDRSPGELVAAGESALVRAEAFEAAGGFRGDAPGVEMADLCVRLRRRGVHVWRVDAAMIDSDRNIRRFGEWWRLQVEKGRTLSVSAALHGSGPDRPGDRRRASALIWGLAFPVCTTLAVGLLAVWGALDGGAVRSAIAALAGLGAAIAVLAARFVFVYLTGAAGPKALSRALLTTLRPFAEFIGMSKRADVSKPAGRATAMQAEA